jgi:apolipoprotein N-acyltransferase
VLASSDYYTSDQQTMIAYVPTKGVRTIYGSIGDMFAWLCLAQLALLTVCPSKWPAAA